MSGLAAGGIAPSHPHVGLTAQRKRSPAVRDGRRPICQHHQTEAVDFPKPCFNLLCGPRGVAMCIAAFQYAQVATVASSKLLLGI